MPIASPATAIASGCPSPRRAPRRLPWSRRCSASRPRCRPAPSATAAPEARRSSSAMRSRVVAASRSKLGFVAHNQFPLMSRRRARPTTARSGTKARAALSCRPRPISSHRRSAPPTPTMTAAKPAPTSGVRKPTAAPSRVKTAPSNRIAPMRDRARTAAGARLSRTRPWPAGFRYERGDRHRRSAAAAARRSTPPSGVAQSPRLPAAALRRDRTKPAATDTPTAIAGLVRTSVRVSSTRSSTDLALTAATSRRPYRRPDGRNRQTARRRCSRASPRRRGPSRRGHRACAATCALPSSAKPRTASARARISVGWTGGTSSALCSPRSAACQRK